MTKSQEYSLYFPAWQKAYRANWCQRKGVIVAKEGRADSQWVKDVEELAAMIASRSFRSFTNDDLRHGAHVLAFKTNASHAEMTNDQLDRFVILCDLLADPTNLQASIDWDNPENFRSRRRVKYLETCGMPEAYIITVAGTKDWRNLNPTRIKNLCVTISNRLRTKSKKQAANTAGVPASNQPF